MNDPESEFRSSPDDAPAPLTLRAAVLFWLKLGCIGFGGPAGQIAIMHSELVEKRRWLSERRFLHALNFCMLLPGPEAQQLATYIGWLLHRSWGGIVAGCLFVLPSFVLIVALSWVYVAFGQTPLIAALFYGIKPAVTAIVVHAAQRIAARTLGNGVLWAIAGAALIAILAFDVPFPAIVAAAALIGALGGRFAPDRFVAIGSAVPQAAARALIDDDSPLPQHARFAWRRVRRVALVGGLLWLLPMTLLAAAFGWQGTLTQIGWFFTKAALLTFGGAYAVLPYVFQGAVGDYGWLSTAQMIDGLALGETTPGPLIMIVAFVGFFAGYGNALFGVDRLLLAGVSGAALATWYTFLPSFIFILIGGPLIETTHGKVRYTAPLTAITAAVVGVVLNLALYFGYHVLWPQGLSGRFDAPAAVIAIAAALALMRWRMNVIAVIAACAASGLLVRMWLV